MKKDQIGINAGKIWKKLDKDQRDTRIEKLKRECKLSAIEFGSAIGWLAREDKITFVSNEKATYVLLKD